MEEKYHPLIKQEFCAKLDEYETMLQKGSHFSSQDFEMVKTIYSGLVKMEAYKGMVEFGEYENPDDMDTSGMSGYRGRSPMTGRYVSRDNRNDRASYEDGYAQGYSEAMNQMNGNSGHYPVMGPVYPRRW